MKKIKWTVLSLLLTAIVLGFTQETGRAQDRKEPAGATAVNSSLAIIFKADMPVDMRLRTVHLLRNNLSSKEIAKICQFVRARPVPDESNLAVLQLIKNDLVNALMDQDSPPGQLTSVLIETYQDQKQDYVTRDYAIQHLVTWFERGVTQPERERIRETLIRAMSENSSMGGTALLGAARLSKADALFDRSKIRERAVEMASLPETDLAARITAIQVCADMGAVEAVPVFRLLAAASSPIALRISAISALGTLGSARDFSILAPMAVSKDRNLDPALHSALAQLRQRFHLQELAQNQN